MCPKELPFPFTGISRLHLFSYRKHKQHPDSQINIAWLRNYTRVEKVVWLRWGNNRFIKPGDYEPAG